MEFIKILLMVFIPILIGIGIYYGFKKFKSSVIDPINIIGRAESAVTIHLKNPVYIKFSSIMETKTTHVGNTWTVQGWVEIKDEWDENERHQYSIDIIERQWKPSKFLYDTKFLNID